MQRLFLEIKQEKSVTLKPSVLSRAGKQGKRQRRMRNMHSGAKGEVLWFMDQQNAAK